MKLFTIAGIVLFANINIFSQDNRIRSNSNNKLDMKKFREQQFGSHSVNPTATSSQITDETIHTVPLPKAAASSTISWQLLCGSMNAHGMQISRSRPLQYNPAINVVSFIHTKSSSYQPNPAVPSAAESGVIVAELSSNWGSNWDSTALWSNASNWGRFPQGALFNPAGNTSINNAQIVSCGPAATATNFSGNWYASKPLNNYNNTANSSPGGQQFLSFTLPSYPPNQRQHGWSRTGFSSTDDGYVRSLALIENDLQGLSTLRGFAVATATFNGMSFDWKIDSLIPNCILDLSGEKHLQPDPQMAWNQAGTVGYIVGIGALSSSLLSNKGYQPIIYKLDKTTNAAATWTLMQGINFNTKCLKPLTYRCALQPITQPFVNGDSIGIPYVNDFDIAVDANNNLHIGLTFMSTATDHPDSLHFVSQFSTSINPTELYKWAHVNGNRPYLYDFFGDGVRPWQAILIDSISSEAPGVVPGQPGYSWNPWDSAGVAGFKLKMDSRIQLARTPDGKFITFSWAESDSSFTFNAYKWNNLPEIKTRLLSVGVNAENNRLNTGPRQNISEVDNNVRTRSTLHYMSPTTGTATVLYHIGLNFTVNINTPLTVTNSSPYSQLTNNSSWFARTTLSYAFNSYSFNFMCDDYVGIDEIAEATMTAVIYPNPTKHYATINTTLKENLLLKIEISNSLGQKIKSIEALGYTGGNKLQIDVNGFVPGIYFVQVKAGNSSTTKKLIVEK